MKRILICLLVALWVGAFQPASSWADPRRQEYDIPGENNNSGDDDNPTKSGAAVGSPAVGQPGRGAQAVSNPPVSAAAPATQHRTSTRQRLVQFVERLVQFTEKLNIKSSR